MLKFFLFLPVSLIIFTSCSQTDTDKQVEDQPSAIQLERESMHQDYIKAIRYNGIPKHYNYLLKKDLDTYSAREMERRIQFGWRLGKVEQLKKDIPMFLSSELYDEVTDGYVDWRSIIQFSGQKCSEWTRFIKMAERLEIYFKVQGDVRSSQAMLGVKIQGAKLLDDRIAQKDYLNEMLAQLEPSDPRYKTYHSMLGWWYQEAEMWNESIEIFQKSYDSSESLNMLGSLMWGLFNAQRYEELVSYEEELLKIEEFKVNYILAKSYQALGNKEKSKRYFEKFRNVNYTGSFVSVYFLEARDNKFYYSDHSYLEDVADYFKSTDQDYACRIYNKMVNEVESALKPHYNLDRERDVVLAQEDPDLQQFHEKRYQTKLDIWKEQLKILRDKSKNCL